MSVTRVNVSIPTDLHARMKQKKGVNWSAAATALFRQMLDGSTIASQLEGEKKQRQLLEKKLAAIKNIVY